jgi:hypothetical protein
MSREYAHQLLDDALQYVPADGRFYWRLTRNNGAKAGDLAGRTDANGYTTIRLLGKDHKAHRLVWLFERGCWPEGQIDHINGDRSDNRIANLRDVSGRVNQENRRRASAGNSSGHLGVRFKANGYEASIKVAGKNIYLGRFKSAEEAGSAYLAAKRVRHEGCTI